MSKKKNKKQSSDAPVNNGDSSDSNSKGKNCTHATVSVDVNQVGKSLKNLDSSRKNFCPICVKENKAIQDNDLFVCLKCGMRTCGKDHSLAHFNTPHSDHHCLAFDFTSQELWCYYCKSKIDEKEMQNGKLNSCLTNLNRQLTLLSNKQKSSNSKVDDSNKENQNDENSHQSAANDGKKGKHNGKNNYTSMQSSMLVKGLANLGNTCYFNSVMQCLARTEPFLEELKDMDHQTELKLELNGGDTLEGCLEEWDPMTECLYETLQSLLTPGPPLTPSRFLGFVRKKHPQFEGHDQHDAHELLRHTLDTIKMNDLRRYRRLMLNKVGLSGKSNPKEVADDVQKQVKELEHKVTQVQTFIPEKTFKGRLVSRVECQECHHSSECIEGFLDLSLPILPYKPHPPCARSKIGNSTAASPVQDNKPVLLSAKELRRQRKMQKCKSSPSAASSQTQAQSQGVDEVAVDALEASKSKSDEMIEGDDHDDNDNDDDEEEKPHESGYSSEKLASSSLRGSPSSEEVRSTSPCDSWTNLSQFNDSWFNTLQEGALLPAQPTTVNESFMSSRPPSKVPLLEDGTPDLSSLSLLDARGATVNALCRDTSSIMQLEPGWRSRIYSRYFGETRKQDLVFGSAGPADESVASSLNQSPSPPAAGCISDVGNGCNVTEKCISEKAESDPQLDGNFSLTEACSDLSPISPDHQENCERSAFGDGPAYNRPVTPPLKKSKWPLVNRESCFPVLKEEENDSLPDAPQFSSTLEVGEPVELSKDSSKPELPEGPEASAPYETSEVSINMAGDSGVVDHVGDTKGELSDTSCNDPVHPSSCSIVRCKKHGHSSEKLHDLASHISAICFSSTVTDKSTCLGDGQAVPNNSYESDCNESSNEKPTRTLAREVPSEKKISPSTADNATLEVALDPSLHTGDDQRVDERPGVEESVTPSEDPAINETVTALPCSNDLDQPAVDYENPNESSSLYFDYDLDDSQNNQLKDSGRQCEGALAADGPPAQPTADGCDPPKEETEEFAHPEMYFGPDSTFTLPSPNGPTSPYRPTVPSPEKLPAIPLPPPTTDGSDSWLSLRSPTKKREDSMESGQYSVESCLQQFTSIELMTGSNLVGCSTCTERQNKGAKDGKTVLRMATKQLLICQAPPVLILHLKRFQVQLHSVRKLNKHVIFPLILDLAPFCSSIGDSNSKHNIDQPMYYSLYGIVEHRGSLNSGHYVAYVKTCEGGQTRWYCISDSHVDEVTEERVLKTPAYLLFYSRLPNGKSESCPRTSTTASTPP
ncbi:ubiquitin carboxyl-terminal hydrolase [Nesidiocoris tenuis]|uniref:Ubiquitin carboxyl-terminal hydrolase n=1 Tax=Nesidiocoris tenuis TaxID=355587 RepID=A0ABN7AJH2_9HEMI|nr:ubiquitin carboxyl-terminal hydrolase [Nesidiocoris tenuis]